ncbi:hypothetical protein T265_09948 [Opisthorchis viverrini]|uniref:DUF7041 domain-containing protein n=1 Tax=Opisthorchis viverrini TaxID=6198 RepID=A0A074Z8C1_OPIVI|nr:hypothetical protein T265_09948 [Opisthorchis viverrini]KER21812.1 hypothetical protein T265_09948 [Opisthorchis viverrini]
MSGSLQPKDETVTRFDPHYVVSHIAVQKFVLLNYNRYRPRVGSNVTLRFLLSDCCCGRRRRNFFCPVIMEAHFDSPDLVENPISIRLPDYNPGNPRVWFHQVEAVFATRRITSQATRFSYIVQHLPCDVATRVEDLLEDIPKENPYDALRAAVISRIGKSEDKMLPDLFTTVELGDRSPSQLLRVFSNAVKDENDTPTNFSKKATPEAIADEVQSRMCANNFQMTPIKTNRKK